MKAWIKLLVFNTILSVCFLLFVIASTLATFTPSLSPEVEYDDFCEDYRYLVCPPDSQFKCSVVGQSVFGPPIICVKCQNSEESGCESTCMADHPDCKKCLSSCLDVNRCECVQNCRHKCTLPENPVTRIAVGCGILFLATAALAFFFKVFLMCCLNSVGPTHSHHEDDNASLNSVDRLVAQRLRDAPPQYDALMAPSSQIGEPRPQNVPLPPDKPPPYNPVPNRGELCLQVSTLPNGPPLCLLYLNSPPPPQTQTPSVTSPSTNPTPFPPSHL